MTRESSTEIKIIGQVNEEDGITADEKTAASCRGVPITERADDRTGGAEEDRTPDLRIANATLSQLSYRPIVLDSIDWRAFLQEGVRSLS
jgi:hypothetical protein